VRTISLEDWQKEGEKLFGKDMKKWKFKCPQCKGIQTLQEFIEIGVEKPENVFFYSCIGRFIEDRGCDWSLGGLLQIHKTEVIVENEKKIPVFEFAIGDEWACTGHNEYGSIWSLGERVEDKIVNRKAVISRCFDGSWRWCLEYNFEIAEMMSAMPVTRGVSPSRSIAMDDVEKLLGSPK
jgi:hypothetical protein